MKIFVIGDSISLRYGPHLKKYLEGLMEYSRRGEDPTETQKLGAPSGTNSRDSRVSRQYVEAMAAAGGIEADVLLLNCGLHDIRRDPETNAIQVPLEEYETNLRAMIRVVREMGVDLVWVRTTPCDEKVHNRPGAQAHRYRADNRAYNESADHVMAEGKVPSIDLHAFTLNLGPDIYCDHVHFHEHICEKQAAFIAGWLLHHRGKRMP